MFCVDTDNNFARVLASQSYRTWQVHTGFVEEKQKQERMAWMNRNATDQCIKAWGTGFNWTWVLLFCVRSKISSIDLQHLLAWEWYLEHIALNPDCNLWIVMRTTCTQNRQSDPGTHKKNQMLARLHSLNICQSGSSEQQSHMIETPSLKGAHTKT